MTPSVVSTVAGRRMLIDEHHQGRNHRSAARCRLFRTECRNARALVHASRARTGIRSGRQTDSGEPADGARAVQGDDPEGAARASVGRTMSRTGLAFAYDLPAVPLSIVTEKLAFLGRTGTGKTYAAMKLAELMLAARAQIGVLDPVGVWHGLRVPAAPGGKAFNVVVFGGLHGDLPLEPHAGALIADVIADKGISFVLDVSQFIARDQQRFAKDFAERFFQRRKAKAAAIHLFMEECQEFLPQNPMGA